MLEIKNLDCGYENIIVRDISFRGEEGDIICLLGANGSGKSTLIKTIVGLISPYEGQILFKGQDIRNWSWRERARQISYIPQYFTSTFQYTGLEIVLMGRSPHLGPLSRPKKEDMKIGERAMDRLGISQLRNKIFSNMSGGERQLVKIAQALAQESKLIIMDEPTNNLDFGNQITMLEQVKILSDTGILVIMATHFPDQALSYGSKALLLKNGYGKLIINPKEGIKASDLEDIYNMKMGIFDVETGEKKQKVCLPI